ncbi:hypothetical protein BUALT_Bualt15G0122900 [Buddleja alternifolia]|uniref:Zinc finger family protein n=1 Tax=Buddleja alternifolia TaxID=168488 RepID=A0AAV6WQB2_9LAMI|nr:hypothetical protein BUALT_Bualt15G0122900 [Buddleja alternifolia]
MGRGIGWRKAFCNTVPPPLPPPRERRREANYNNNDDDNIINMDVASPKLECKTTQKSPRKTLLLPSSSNPSSPRSPFSILKNTLRLSRNSSCGVCMQSVKAGREGMAIYTASCSHTFHFPCIASHVTKQSSLVCPLCNTTWKDIPLLPAIHAQNQKQRQENILVVDSNNTPSPTKHTPICSPKYTKHYQLKSYGDDEPLVTPKFIPIPVPIPESVKDEEEEEEEEFRGFFVNPILSSDDAFASNRDSRNVEVSLLPDAAALISQGTTHDTYVVVLKVKAPPPLRVRDAASRAPIDLVAVLDVSGSMSGAKLKMLKRAMRLVISSLGSADRLSLVAFSAAPKRLLPLKRMTAQGQRSARRIIDRLSCSQGTSMAEALKQATRVLEQRREKNPVATIILLSDGQDDTVPTNNDSNQRRGSSHLPSTRFAHIEIPVHLSSLNHQPDEDAFTRCVGGLLSVVVQDLRIQLGFASGSNPAEITAVYSRNERPIVLGSGQIRLGDLYAEEDKEVLIELRVPASTVGSQHHVLSVKCCYKDPSTQELIYGRDQALLVPRPESVRSGLPRIERLRDVFINIRAMAESRRLIEHNELFSAMQLLSSARALLLQSRSESAGEYVRGLEAELAEVQWRRQYQRQIEQQQQMVLRRRTDDREMGLFVDENGEPITPTSAWRAAEKLAKVAQTKKYLNRTGDLHGFENARF